MYAAFNQQQELVYAANQPERNQLFYCPYCQQKVTLKLSKKNKWYFAHYTQCASAINQRQAKGESLAHQKGKVLLARSSIEAKLEVWLPTIQQQIDCYLPIPFNQRMIVLEFQHSIIAPLLLKQRHLGYLSEADEVYWFLDSKAWSAKWTKWLQTMVHYDESLGYYWLVLNIQREELLIYSQIPLICQSNRWLCQVRKMKLKNNWFSEHDSTTFIEFIQSIPMTKQSFTVQKPRKLKGVQLKRSIQLNQQYRDFLFCLQTFGVTVDFLPNWIFEGEWQCLYFETPMWTVLAYLWAATYQEKVISAEIVGSTLFQLAQKQWIRYAQLPLVTQDNHEQLVQALVQCLNYFR